MFCILSNLATWGKNYCTAICSPTLLSGTSFRGCELDGTVEPPFTPEPVTAELNGAQHPESGDSNKPGRRADKHASVRADLHEYRGGQGYELKEAKEKEEETGGS